LAQRRRHGAGDRPMGRPAKSPPTQRVLRRHANRRPRASPQRSPTALSSSRRNHQVSGHAGAVQIWHLTVSGQVFTVWAQWPRSASCALQCSDHERRWVAPRVGPVRHARMS
jgi:hypothetical protein